MNQPDQHMIDRALDEARKSPCRSKRGVALYDMSTGAFRGAGHNGPPTGCPGRAICAGTCGQRSVHAEMRALRGCERFRWNGYGGRFDLIHVERAPGGGVVACDGPSCWQCAREILDVGFVAGVWLYESVPEENCPHIVELRRIDCPLCQGEACDMCGAGACRRDYDCDHDVLDRHHGLPTIDAIWRRYEARHFYEATLKNCGIPQ